MERDESATSRIRCPMCRRSSGGYTVLCASSDITSECPICLEPRDDLAVLHDCGHLYCRACLEGLEVHSAAAEEDDPLVWEEVSELSDDLGEDDLSVLLFGESARSSFRRRAHRRVQRRRALPIEVARAMPLELLGWPSKTATFGPFDFLGSGVFWHFRPEFNQHVLVDGLGNLCQRRGAEPRVPAGQVADWVRGRWRRNRRWRMLPDPERLPRRRHGELMLALEV